MRIDRRTWRALGSIVLLVVLVLVATRLGGPDGPGGPDAGPATATDRSSSSAGVRPGGSTSSTSPDAGGTGAAVDAESGLPFIDEADLPDEALDVLRAIDDGGPFDFPAKDGSTFGNYEGELPDEPRGHYREYTVITPGASGRGPRRIVTGGGAPTSYFWTDDHYDSFSRIRR